MRRALVLAGGGYVASSWEIGLVTGMADAGLDVRNADLFVGTSAGARVALDLTSGKPLDQLYEGRAELAGPLGPARPRGAPPAIDWARIRSGVDDAKAAGGSPADILRRYGALAMTVAVAVLVFPLGLLALSQRRSCRIVVAFAPERGGGSEITIYGTAPLALRRAFAELTE